MRQPVTASAFRTFLKQRKNVEVLRIHYCYQLGSTFTNLALMEDTIIDAMLMCDRVKVGSLLGPDESAWDRLINKRTQLRDSTLGSLISLLSRHGLESADLHYLKWVKAKRDFFVHRFFHKYPWPGDLRSRESDLICRKLLYLEIIFSRASHRIWKIFSRAKLLGHQETKGEGFLMFNLDMFGDEDKQEP